MRGLLLNLVAKLAAQDDDGSDEVWELFLALGRARQLTATDPLDKDDDHELLSLPPMKCGGQTAFHGLVRSIPPFCDEDWDDIPGAPFELQMQPSHPPAPLLATIRPDEQRDDEAPESSPPSGHGRGNSTPAGDR